VPDKNAKVLDIGCGTGIATRQLKQYGFGVVGADKGIAMIRFARGKGDGIPYVVAPAHKLPFRGGEFDLVTAFTAFHWFEDGKSVREIKRVLKRGGIFFAAQKMDHPKSVKVKSKRVEKLRRGYRAMMDRYFGKNVDSAKGYDPERTLKQYGFSNIAKRTFYIREKYTLKQAMALLKSTSNWNLLSEARKREFYKDIEEFYKQNLIRGFVVRDSVVRVVVGYLT
jgi:ubiquinone/menaquinone biosynthesis C-methylase UbiE